MFKDALYQSPRRAHSRMPSAPERHARTVAARERAQRGTEGRARDLGRRGRALSNLALSLLTLTVCLAGTPAWAQTRTVADVASGPELTNPPPESEQRSASSAVMAEAGPARDLDQWLARLRQTGSERAYTGTYVVWLAPGVLVSSRIWHVSQDGQRIERVDALSGAPRSTYRATDRHGGEKIQTFWNARRVVRVEHVRSPDEGGFPNLPDAGQGTTPADHYKLRQIGQERVAGFMTDVVQLMPRDKLRYGYRVWSERGKGLVVRLQTLDERGRVLEQAAFSDLTFDAPLSVARLRHEMHHRHGWQIERVERMPTTAQAEGWQIGGVSGQPVPGFVLQNCYRQSLSEPSAQAQVGGAAASEASAAVPASGSDAVAAPASIQCVFSDGLAAVSLFMQGYDAARHDAHPGERNWALGATHLLAHRVDGTGWVVAVGEVPQQTLKRFIAGVSRQP